MIWGCIHEAKGVGFKGLGFGLHGHCNRLRTVWTTVLVEGIRAATGHYSDQIGFPGIGVARG